jgi:hypothetical protein
MTHLLLKFDMWLFGSKVEGTSFVPNKTEKQISIRFVKLRNPMATEKLT